MFACLFFVLKSCHSISSTILWLTQCFNVLPTILLIYDWILISFWGSSQSESMPIFYQICIWRRLYLVSPSTIIKCKTVQMFTRFSTCSCGERKICRSTTKSKLNFVALDSSDEKLLWRLSLHYTFYMRTASV